ncbi:hypothetical protein [Paraferrimonas sp. SM1919]|uniref:PKD domain-containing protein n=1 Tax=Paraferrimonas sp. SM1919 TaxID=2662263 RepID=UPI0013D7EA20|nr:hypothetical protein [Paraferrimonas sp. SM1919]
MKKNILTLALLTSLAACSHDDDSQPITDNEIKFVRAPIIKVSDTPIEVNENTDLVLTAGMSPDYDFFITQTDANLASIAWYVDGQEIANQDSQVTLATGSVLEDEQRAISLVVVDVDGNSSELELTYTVKNVEAELGLVDALGQSLATDIELMEGASLSIDAITSYFDIADNSELNFTWQQTSALFDETLLAAATGSLALTAPVIDSAFESTTLSVTVADIHGHDSVSQEFNVTVVSDNANIVSLEDFDVLDNTEVVIAPTVLSKHFAEGGLTYTWEVVAGNFTLTAEQASAQQQVITTPQGSDTIVLQLTVTDTNGKSASDKSVITVTEQNQAPVIESISAPAADLVKVDGDLDNDVVLRAVTSDANGDALTHTWALAFGDASVVQVNQVEEELTLTFDSAAIFKSQDFVFRYTVDDGRGKSATEDVVVSVVASNLIVRTPSLLDGKDGALVDNVDFVIDSKVSQVVPQGTISYSWKDANGVEVGTDATYPLPITLANVDTDYEFELTVSDGVDTIVKNVTVNPQRAAVGAVVTTHSLGLSGALHEDGSVTVWQEGMSTAERYAPYGAETSPVISLNATSSQIVALKEDGTVKAWGSFSDEAATLVNVQKIQTFESIEGFVAYHKDGSATIVAYKGDNIPDNGANILALTPAASTYFAEVRLTRQGYAALQSDGVVDSWHAGVITNETGVKALYSSLSQWSSMRQGFIALKEDGTTVSWGVDAHTYTLTTTSANPAIHVDLVNVGAVALLADGTISGVGSVATPAAGKHLVLQGNHASAVAIKEDGTLSSWGNANGGGIATYDKTTGVQGEGQIALTLFENEGTQSEASAALFSGGVVIRQGRGHSRAYWNNNFYKGVYKGAILLPKSGELVNDKYQVGEAQGGPWVIPAELTAKQVTDIQVGKQTSGALSAAVGLTRDGIAFHIATDVTAIPASWTDAQNYVQGSDMALLDDVDTSRSGMTNGDKRALCPALDIAAGDTYAITGGIPCLLTGKADSDGDGLTDAYELNVAGSQPFNEYSNMHKLDDSFTLPTEAQAPDGMRLTIDGKPAYWVRPSN